MKIKAWFIMLILAMLLPVLAACAANQASDAPPEIQGPALVMFYTDN